MRCRSCLTENPLGNRFCESCGEQLQLGAATINPGLQKERVVSVFRGDGLTLLRFL